MVWNISQIVITFISAVSFYRKNFTKQSSIYPFVIRILLLLIGLFFAGLWIIARLQHGSLTFGSFSNGPLITTGVYSFCRHPIYVFGTAGLIMYLLLLEEPWYFSVLIIILPVQLIRAMREDVQLKKQFGLTYSSYKRHVRY